MVTKRMIARKAVAVLPALLVAALVAGCTSGGGSSQNASAGSSTGTSDSSGSGADKGLSGLYEKVVDNVLKSVVQITTSQGLGSGIVYDDKGDIVTNAHVVGNAKTFQVTTATSNQPIDATLVASYPPSDLAVIKVSGKLPEPPAKFGDSSKLDVGEQVMAMGSPLGLSGSVTNGIVSALGRTVQEPGENGSPGTTISDMIQTSAPINPGNSGGALVDLNSRVVGIPTLAATSKQEGGAAPGIGFAISSNTVTRIADQIIKNGKVTQSGRAKLGVTVRQVLNSNYQPAGAGVVSVQSGGPAAKAGIQPGDVITALGNTQINTLSDLSRALAEHKPGDTVQVTVVRNGTTTKIPVKLGQQ